MTDTESSTTAVPMFMRNATDTKIKGMNDTARDIEMTLRTSCLLKVDGLRERVADLLSPQMPFNEITASYPLLWSAMCKYLVDLRVARREHQRPRAV